MNIRNCKNKVYRAKDGSLIVRHWIEQRQSWEYYVLLRVVPMWIRAGNQLWCEFECAHNAKLIGINLSDTGL